MEQVSIEGHAPMDIQSAINEITARVEAAKRLAEEAKSQHVALDASHSSTSTRTHLDLPDYSLVPSLPSFDGERPEQLLGFFESIETVGELCNWQDKEQLQVAKLKLSGTALQYYRGESALGKATSWVEFKKVLSERFSDKIPSQFYAQQLSSIRQRPGETIEAFADRVRALTEKTVRKTANEEVNKALREEADLRALHAFVQGLTGVVGEQTKLKFPTSLREAITLAISIEHLNLSVSSRTPVLPPEREKKVFRTEVICYTCHEKGHISRDCKSRKAEAPVPNSRKPQVCYRCHRPGHIAKVCLAKYPMKRPSGNEKGASETTVAEPQK